LAPLADEAFVADVDSRVGLDRDIMLRQQEVSPRRTKSLCDVASSRFVAAAKSDEILEPGGAARCIGHCRPRSQRSEYGFGQRTTFEAQCAENGIGVTIECSLQTADRFIVREPQDDTVLGAPIGNAFAGLDGANPDSI
jgi:hypothetical protein